MLYTDTATGYPKLTEVLDKLSLPEEALDVLKNYLDLSKPRDNSLLKKLSPVQLPFKMNWQYREEIQKAVSREIVKKNSSELSERFVLLMFSLLKSTCHFFIPEQVTKLKSGAVVFSPKDHFDSIAVTLTDLLGNEAQAAAYAVHIDYAFYNGGTFRLPLAAEPSVCMIAAKYLNSICHTDTQRQYHYSGLALCCTYALEQSAALDAPAQSAADTVLELWKKRSELVGEAFSYLMCATAEAARFEHQADVRFRKEWKDLTRPTVEKMCSLPTIPIKALDHVENDPSLVTSGFIAAVAYTGGRLEDKQQRLERYAASYPDRFKAAISIVGDNVVLSRDLSDILRRSSPEYAKAVNEIIDKNRRRLAENVKEQFGGKAAVYDYIMGTASYEEAAAAAKGWCIGGSFGSGWDYYKAYGVDEFLARAFTVMMKAEYNYGRIHRIERATGFSVEGHEAEAFDMLRSCGPEFDEIIDLLAVCTDDMYSKKEDAIAAITDCAAACKEELAALDVPKLNATGRVIAAKALGKSPEEYKQKLLSLSDDGSKAVRAELAAVISGAGWRDEVCSMLAAKKAAKRELAIEIISRQGASGYEAELSRAFESEKSDKIKAKIGALTGAALPAEAKEQSREEQLSKLIKTSKNSKLSFLFSAPLKPVHKQDGSEAGEDYMKALIMCYAPMTAPARSKLADDLASALDRKELEAFAADIFGRWFDDGAQAKTKSALYFCAIHGGVPMVRTLMRCIKDWAENMRGAIAAEATRALALAGSSEALMNIDTMSRKFKNKQVRSAAAEALASAAEALGITTEELADRIVPDLGFDERLCRVFDFGPRQFSVCLTPSLGLEVFNGDKQLKNLPKPSAGDDQEKAEAACSDFKELKKQLKTVVTAQKARLEYVLMLDRKWSAQGWKKLFVENAVMHCFAVGLIWGEYENGKLIQSFRYLDDGSFTTADEEEYTLPDTAQIGLVHPLELTAEQLSAWKEQLSDYEIIQPFDQLGRKIYRLDDKEKDLTACTRFEYAELNSLALVGKMTKLGWYKGQAEDAGFFYYFYREDIQSRSRNADGSSSVTGNGAMLIFSGASIAAYDFEGEEVQLEKLVFFNAGKVPDYYDKKETGWLKLSDVNPRYFSEIILQLCSVTPPPTGGSEQD